MKQFFILALAVLVCALANAAPATTHSLSGSYEIGGKTLIDPPENEAQDTHFRVYLTGKPAKDLYLAMHVRPVKDECLMDGSITKAIGGTACTKLSNGAFECSFSVNIKSQRVESASVC